MDHVSCHFTLNQSKLCKFTSNSVSSLSLHKRVVSCCAPFLKWLIDNFPIRKWNRLLHIHIRRGVLSSQYIPGSLCLEFQGSYLFIPMRVAQWSLCEQCTSKSGVLEIVELRSKPKFVVLVGWMLQSEDRGHPFTPRFYWNLTCECSWLFLSVTSIFSRSTIVCPSQSNQFRFIQKNVLERAQSQLISQEKSPTGLNNHTHSPPSPRSFYRLPLCPVTFMLNIILNWFTRPIGILAIFSIGLPPLSVALVYLESPFLWRAEYFPKEPWITILYTPCWSRRKKRRTNGYIRTAIMLLLSSRNSTQNAMARFQTGRWFWRGSWNGKTMDLWRSCADGSCSIRLVFGPPLLLKCSISNTYNRSCGQPPHAARPDTFVLPSCTTTYPQVFWAFILQSPDDWISCWLEWCVDGLVLDCGVYWVARCGDGLHFDAFCKEGRGENP